MCEKTKFSRLSNNVKPLHYRIHLTPDLENFTYIGKETIEIKVNESTDTIVLNAADFTYTISLTSSVDGKINSYTPKEIVHDDLNETLTIVYPEKLLVGKTYFLNIDFEGKINDKMKGLYRSKYLSHDGIDKYAAVTQFAPSDARRCFPCWDEPSFKSIFEISLTVRKDLTTLSNMPVKSTKSLSETLHCVEFEPSPIMSSYLVALAIGDFDYVEDRTVDGVLVRVYTPKGKKEQGTFALEVATKVLPYYKDYFNISYPLPKIDLIAIADCMFAAMENWGLITYREMCLLVDPQNTSKIQKQRIALVVSHELAHQWFGNLVTMEWWTHLWLNEGYASFIEFMCVDHLFPQYDIWTQFVTDMFIEALKLDALKNSHPIEVPIGHPSEINEIFDAISYNKGASIIRMLYAYIGDDDFKKGMNLYLTRHSYSNAKTNDLWKALEEASNKPINYVMSLWTEKQGYPIIEITEMHSTNVKNRTFSITQHRFLADGSRDKTSLWSIPLSFSTASNPTKPIKTELFDTEQKVIVLENVPSHSWIKVNPGTVGFYRTMYSPDLLELLIPAIQNKSLPPLDRLGLLDDLLAVCQAGQASTIQVLKLMKAFQKEDNYTVWCSILNCLSKIQRLISHLEIYPKYKEFGRNLLQDICTRLGWNPEPNETHQDTLLRSLILGRMVMLEHEETLKIARSLFNDHMSGKCTISADSRNLVYRAVLISGGAEELETMLKLYRKTDLQEEKNRILGALDAVKDETLFKQILEFAMSDEVRSNNTAIVFHALGMSHKGRIFAWQFFKDHWDELVKRYKGGVLLPKLITVSTTNFVTEERASDVEEFFKKHPISGTERSVQQSLESIHLNAAWLVRDKKEIEHFFLNQE